jgi:transcriptional regulator of acetoin/glycerol metabolism
VIQTGELPPEIVDAAAPYRPSTSTPHEEHAQPLAALEQAHGSRMVAARLLGISRATLYRRLASLKRRLPP